MSDEIRITELDVPGAMEVVLAGDDMPTGGERESAAFESGGKLVMERLDLPGRTAPIFHVHAAPERPFVIKGAFYDWLTSAGHARVMRDQLLEIWRRANLLRLVWDNQERVVLLDEPKFGEESLGSITYELTFEVATAPDSLSHEAPAPAVLLSDLVNVMTARLAARRAALARLSLERGILAEMLAAVDGVLGALNDVQREVDGLDRIVGDVGARVRRVLSVGQRAQNLLAGAQRLVGRVRAEGDATVRTAETVAETWQAQFAAGVTFLDVADGLRLVRQRARERTRQGERLYRVKPGDTLESIARAMLGSAARTGELGVRADELAPGGLIRLPGSA